jgi:hypothetical protein
MEEDIRLMLARMGLDPAIQEDTKIFVNFMDGPIKSAMTVTCFSDLALRPR